MNAIIRHSRPQKAIHITNSSGLHRANIKGYQCLYWGAEFCQQLIPTIKDTSRALAFAKRQGLEFVLMTPFVTDAGLDKLQKIFAFLEKEKQFCEIVVNDWGVLEHLHSNFRRFSRLALGRLLVRQFREPDINNTIKKQELFFGKATDGRLVIMAHRPPGRQYRHWVRSSFVNIPAAQDFLAEKGITRVELNNLIQGLELKGVKLRKSIYTPFVNVSTGRFCPMSNRRQKLYRINVCLKECQKYSDILKCGSLELIRRGNTVFYRNPLEENSKSAQNADRIVYQPQPPF